MRADRQGLQRWIVEPGEICASCQSGIHDHMPEVMRIPAYRRCSCDGDCASNHPEWGRTDKYLAKCESR